MQGVLYCLLQQMTTIYLFQHFLWPSCSFIFVYTVLITTCCYVHLVMLCFCNHTYVPAKAPFWKLPFPCYKILTFPVSNADLLNFAFREIQSMHSNKNAWFNYLTRPWWIGSVVFPPQIFGNNSYQIITEKVGVLS